MLALMVSVSNVAPTVSQNTIVWPDNGWYKVQSASNYQSLCEGGNSCTVRNGTYTIINHSLSFPYHLKAEKSLPVSVNSMKQLDAGDRVLSRMDDAASLSFGQWHRNLA